MQVFLAAIATDFSPGQWIDIVAGTLLALAMVLGAISKFSGELSRLIAFSAALATAALVYGPVREHIFWPDSSAHRVLALCTTILAGALIGFGIRKVTKPVVASLFSQPFDSIFGAVARTFIVAVIILSVFAVCRVIPEETVQRSVFAESYVGRISRPILDHFEKHPISVPELK